MAEERKGQLLHMRYDDQLLRRVDDFRFKHRFESRSEAVRWLLDWALKQKPVLEHKGE
jgi:metal-responsive CopG/Arc/MetJ family transcriptional regulator